MCWPQSPPIAVPVEGWFEVRSELTGAALHDFAVCGSHVVALVANRENSEIVVSDRLGTVTSRLRLPVREQFVTCAPSGTVAVGRNGARGTHAITMARLDAGISLRTVGGERTFEGSLIRLGALQDGLYGLGNEGLWRYPETNQVGLEQRARLTSTLLNDPFLPTQLSMKSMGVVTVMNRPTITEIGDTGQIKEAIPLRSRAIDKKVAELEPDEGSIVVVGSDPAKGKLYCVVSGFNLAQSISVDEFGSNGDFLRSLALGTRRFPSLVVPANSPNRVSNASGFFAPSAVLASGDYLYLAHRSPGVIMFYKLP